MGKMRDADWSRETLLRCDWLPPSVAPYTTKVSCIMTLELDERRFGLLPVLVASKVNNCAAKFLALPNGKAELSFKEN